MAFVYLLADMGRDYIYKIGVTKCEKKEDILKRVKSLQTGNSGEIHLCNYFESKYPFKLEKSLHKKFGCDRIHGEWFELTDEQAMKFIEHCEQIEKTFILLEDNPFFNKNTKYF